MARKPRSTRAAASATGRQADRLDLIKQRHAKLILQPRAAIAAEMDHELGDPFEAPLEVDHVEYAEMADLVRF